MAESCNLQCTASKDGTAHVAPGTHTKAAHASISGNGKDGARTVNAWREQWRQLGLQAWAADSDSRRETQNPRSLSQEHLEELRSTLQKGADNYRVWERELWGGITKVRKRIQVLARNIHFAPQEGDIRRMVQAAEHDLHMFGEQTRQEENELAALECSLQDTLESSLVRFEGWCSQESALRKPLDFTPQKPSRPPSCSRLRQGNQGSSREAKQLESMHEQLDKLEADIANNGGSTGGWSYEDNDTFHKVFLKFKRKTGVEFIAEAQQLLSHKRHEDLVSHISWMLLYDDRQIQKKQLVEKWRCMRAVAASKDTTPESKKELTAAAAREEKRQRACSRERVQKKLVERRQLVVEWRSARNEEQLSQQEEKQKRLAEAHQRDAAERRRQAEHKRKAIETGREQRAADEMLLGKSRNTASAPIGKTCQMLPEDRKRIAERNTALLQKRAALLQAKRPESSEAHSFEPPLRASSLGAQLQAAYKHVESRLEESTQLYVDRSRDMRDDQSMTCQDGSKYGAVAGNFAHQGMVRTMRASASWRPHFGA